MILLDFRTPDWHRKVHKWFAWHPVTVERGCAIAWLETVYRTKREYDDQWHYARLSEGDFNG